MSQGGCSVDMLEVEKDIRSKRNAIKYQDVQEHLNATG